jgi:hypothetical protein
MAELVTTCPSCRNRLEVTQLHCDACETKLEGHFAIPALLRLPEEDLRFVIAFVRSSGSLKEMAARDGVSYPTVRNRLDAIIARMEALDEDRERRRHEILDALESGKMSAKAAAAALKKVGS